MVIAVFVCREWLPLHHQLKVWLGYRDPLDLKDCQDLLERWDYEDQEDNRDQSKMALCW